MQRRNANKNQQISRKLINSLSNTIYNHPSPSLQFANWRESHHLLARIYCFLVGFVRSSVCSVHQYTTHCLIDDLLHSLGLDKWWDLSSGRRDERNKYSHPTTAFRQDMRSGGGGGKRDKGPNSNIGSISCARLVHLINHNINYYWPIKGRIMKFKWTNQARSHLVPDRMINSVQ